MVLAPQMEDLLHGLRREGLGMAPSDGLLTDKSFDALLLVLRFPAVE